MFRIVAVRVLKLVVVLAVCCSSGGDEGDSVIRRGREEGLVAGGVHA